ncbi:MAG: polysaccharide biosynthesis/export family protein [Oligoflexus sp.]
MIKLHSVLILLFLIVLQPAQANDAQEVESSAETDVYDPRNDHHQQTSNPRSGLEVEPFGNFLFQGQFAHQSFTGFNPDYQINIGDQITVRLWGAVEFDQSLVVDRQGNIFLPGVGPVPVKNVRNSQLQRVINQHVRKVFQKNVHTYTSLTTNQSVKVYVTGFVHKPGLYAGLNTDSILYYLDKARGIDPERGSFTDIQVMRSGNVLHQVNLYTFILNGSMPTIQFQDGDTILVNSRHSTVRVTGMVQNENDFELKEKQISVKTLLTYAKPKDKATHVRVLQNLGLEKKFSYFALDKLQSFNLSPGDQVEVLSDQTLNNISVRIQGEHDGVKEAIFARGTSLSEVLDSIQYTSLSDRHNIQLFRKSIKEVQKERLHQSLSILERSILSANPASREEAELRAREAEMVLKLIERARKLEPTGQVVLARGEERRDMILESGDILHIPQKTQVVMVHGEVLFPNAVAFSKADSVAKYITRAGGFTQRANQGHIVVLHRDGSFSVQYGGWFSSNVDIQPGDEIFVIPEVDTKTLQLAKDIAQILYQIAVTTKVVLTI